MEQGFSGDELVRKIEWTSGILLAVLVVAAWVAFSIRMGIGVLLGGVVASLSFQVLKWQLRKAFRDPRHVPPQGRIFFSYYLRYLATLFAVFTIIYYGWADPIAFVVGLSVVVLSIVVVGGQEFLRLLVHKGDH